MLPTGWHRLLGRPKISESPKRSKSRNSSERPVTRFSASLRRRVRGISPLDYLCDNDICPICAQDGHLMYFNYDHLRRSYVREQYVTERRHLSVTYCFVRSPVATSAAPCAAPRRRPTCAAPIDHPGVPGRFQWRMARHAGRPRLRAPGRRSGLAGRRAGIGQGRLGAGAGSASSPGRRRKRVPALAIRRTAGDMPSRVADNFFWLGRYLERLEGAARLLRVALTRLFPPRAGAA